MRLFSACFPSPVVSSFKALAGRTVCQRWRSHRVHKRVEIGIGLVLGIAFSGPAIAHPIAIATNDPHRVFKNDTSAEYIRPAIICPTDVSTLAPLLFRDLPSYANRVSTRAQVLERSFNPRGVVVAAAQAETDEGLNTVLPVEALLPENEAITTFSLEQDLASHNLIPFFFTTLERQYVDDQAVRLQHYHWAFLSQTFQKKDPQWHLALMFSRLGDYPADQPVAPPRESRQGSIGQALQLWLRDCNAGSVAELQPGDQQ